MFFSLSLGKGQTPIAEIVMPKKKGEPEESNAQGKKDKKKVRKFVYLNELEARDDNAPRELKMTGREILRPIMRRQAGGYPNRVFIAGASLCGKSYLASKLAKDYMLNFKKNKVINFSWVNNDKNYDKLKNYHKMRIDEDLLDNPIELGELHDSICIFDDIHHFTDKHIRMEMERLRDSCLQAGRHENIDVVVCTQNILDGARTKHCVNNTFQIIGFPQSAARYQLGEYLRRYMRLPQDKVRMILSLPSRWILINQSTPVYILHEKGVFFL